MPPVQPNSLKNFAYVTAIVSCIAVTSSVIALTHNLLKKDGMLGKEGMVKNFNDTSLKMNEFLKTSDDKLFNPETGLVQRADDSLKKIDKLTNLLISFVESPREKFSEFIDGILYSDLGYVLVSFMENFNMTIDDLRDNLMLNFEKLMEQLSDFNKIFSGFKADLKGGVTVGKIPLEDKKSKEMEKKLIEDAELRRADVEKRMIILKERIEQIQKDKKDKKDEKDKKDDESEEKTK